MDAAQCDLHPKWAVSTAVNCFIVEFMMSKRNTSRSVQADTIANNRLGITEPDIIEGDGTLQFKSGLAMAVLRCAKDQRTSFGIISLYKGTQDASKRRTRDIGDAILIAQDVDIDLVPFLTAARTDEQRRIEDEFTLRNDLRG